MPKLQLFYNHNERNITKKTPSLLEIMLFTVGGVIFLAYTYILYRENGTDYWWVTVANFFVAISWLGYGIRKIAQKSQIND